MPYHTQDPRAEHSGHLNSTWEIAILVILILLIVVIVLTTGFSIRRKKQRRQRQAMEDAEMGRSIRTSRTRTTLSEKTAIQEPQRAASPPWHAASSASTAPYLEPSKTRYWPEPRS